MSVDMVMPRLSDSMEEGTILTWIKAVGDPVALGEELVEIETDRANMVFEADAAGETLPIGAVIARVGEPAEAKPDGGAKRREAGGDQGPPATPPRGIGRQRVARVSPAEVGQPPARMDAKPAAPAMADGRVKARRWLSGSPPSTGLISRRSAVPGGRVVKANVEAVIASGSASTDRTLRSSLSEQPSASSPAQAGSRRSSLDAEEHPPSVPISVTAPAGSLLGGDPALSAKGRVEVVEPTKLQ